ncbi:MAG: hypothetical protein A4S17_02135 [Proteobacteria bacterium HN_bin10]|jgi:hypothetical protein|nr:MAG: hypothetical protein A4S17_02135 [Proteobacteria bacterium HN_bin10]
MDIELEGPGAFAVDVVGEAQYQDVLEAAGEAGAVVAAALVLEDSNPHDDRAVAVCIDGRRAGYLSRADARRYRADLAAAGVPRAVVRCKARITGGFARAGGGRAHFGLKLDLPNLTP